MFTHFQKTGKCEWLDGGLSHFVAHYNSARTSSYLLSDCLDLRRNGGDTQKAPEVRVTDPTTNLSMVIERKSVAWPRDYILKHQNEHAFANAFWEAAGDAYNSGCFELNVQNAQLSQLPTNDVRRLAAQIGNQVSSLSPSNFPARSGIPITWSLRECCPEEHDGRLGIAVIHNLSPCLDFDDDSDIQGVLTVTQEQLQNCARKFVPYVDDRKVVLLDFYGDSLDEEGVAITFRDVNVPEIIDEVWRTYRDWVDAEEFEIGYECIFPRSSV